MTTHLCLTEALKYLRHGWSPIALCPADHAGVHPAHLERCHQPGKSPLWSWKDYQERLPRESELRLWWNRNPACNVGIALGPVSGLVGLDIDGPEGEALLLEWAGEHGIPETVSFSTPSGGRRLFFQWPEREDIPIRSWRNAEGKEILRVLARGSQTVMPPSCSAKGQYRWVGRPEAVPLPRPEEWLLSHIRRQEPVIPARPAAPLPPVSEDVQLGRAQRYLEQCDPCISGQGGQRQIYKLACKLLHGFHLCEADTFALLSGGYNDRCQPPWSERELWHHIENAAKKGTSRDMGESTKKRRDWGEPAPIKFPGEDQGGQAQPAKDEAEDIVLSGVEPQQVEWLWEQHFPLGMLSCLDGDPNLGKSTVLLDIAARVSTSGIMPDESQGIAGNVIILSAEDSAAHTIVPRLMAAGTCLDNVSLLTSVGGQPVVIPHHIDKIEALVRKRDARLLVIDPLTAVLDACLKSDQEVRKALYPLAQMAERCRCAVIYLRHLNKGLGTKAIYRGGGSIAIIGAARAGFLVAEDPERTATHRVFAHVKWNVATRQPSLGYTLDFVPCVGQCRVGWTGPVPYDADSLLKPPPTEEQEAAEAEKATKMQQAMRVIQDELADGEKTVAAVKAAGRQLEISPSTMERASRELRVLLRRESGVYYWRMPGT